MLSATSRSSSTVPTGSKTAVSRVFSSNKSPAVDDTAKQIQRRLLKTYEHNCAADDSLALSSVKRTLRAGIHQNSFQAKVII